MESVFIHLAKSSALLLAAYLVYQLLVRFTTFHYLNRAYLLLSIGISLLIPFIHLPVEESHIAYAYTLSTIDLGAEAVQANPKQSINFSYVLCLLYGLACIALSVKFFFYLSGLVNMLYKHPKKRFGKFTLVRSKAYDQAFSFFRYIVIPDHLTQTDEQIIIEHEMLHAHKWHSADVLLMELLKIIFWFHPVIYLLKQELIQQHEFEIDRLLTTHKIDVEQYGNLLIQQAQVIPIPLILANNFNHSLIKNRIKMMTKPKSNKIQLLRYALLLPVLGLIGALMAFEKQPFQPALLEVLKVEEEPKPTNFDDDPLKFDNQKTKTIQSISKQSNHSKIDSNETDLKSTSVVFTIVEEMPKFPGGDIALLEYFSSNIRYPEAAKLADIQGVVVIGFTVDRDGSINELKIIRDIGGGCGDEAIRLAKLMPKWSPGKQYGKAERVAFKLPVRFKLEENQESTKNTTPITLSNEKKEILEKLSELGVNKVTWVDGNPAVRTIAEQMPEFPNGDEALLQFFGSNIKYPEAAKKEEIQGVVVLEFIVEMDGSISNLKVIREIGGGCGEEALRIAKQMPNWSPGMEEGKTVRVSFKLPVRFKLDSEEPQPKD